VNRARVEGAFRAEQGLHGLPSRHDVRNMHVHC
jgi:hypothetical protein